MAESMSRREAMALAWRKAWQNRGIWPPPTDYEDGFNAAWDKLLSEIRPLVADLFTTSPISGHPIHAPDDNVLAHNVAVNRLRALVREGE